MQWAKSAPACIFRQSTCSLQKRGSFPSNPLYLIIITEDSSDLERNLHFGLASQF